MGIPVYRMATGRADDLASTLLLATDTPVLVAPAMNGKMWQHPATQRNVAQLKQDGCQFIDPAEGELACGYEGIGPVEWLAFNLNKKPLDAIAAWI